MNKGIIAGLIIALVVIAGGAFALSQNSSPKTADSHTATTQATPTPNTIAPTSSPTPTSASGDQLTPTTITYTNNGFTPNKVTVMAGTAVTVKNNSSSAMQFDSDPHPAHTDDPELNVGIVQPGKSMIFTPETKGTWGFHNHLNESDRGTIVVQ